MKQLIFAVFVTIFAVQPGYAACFVNASQKSCDDVGYITRASEVCKGFKLLLKPDEFLRNQREFKSGHERFGLALQGYPNEHARIRGIALRVDRSSGLQILKAPD